MLPLSLAEGACAGAALVASPVGNVSEIVRDGENGRLVARDPAALADCLAGLIADRGALGRMQVAARRHYEAALTIEAFAAHLGGVYAEAMPQGAALHPPKGTPFGIPDRPAE